VRGLTFEEDKTISDEALSHAGKLRLHPRASTPASWLRWDGKDECSGILKTREIVGCDQECGAYREPETLEEYKAAFEHWMNHGYLGGCSHGQ
jgi:hypothetical protein